LGIRLSLYLVYNSESVQVNSSTTTITDTSNTSIDKQSNQ